MRAAYASANFSQAAALYDERGLNATLPIDLVLMRARIALRCDPASALDLLLGYRKRFERSPDQFAAEALLGSSFAALRDYASADAHFERARALLDRRSRSQAATLANTRARRYIGEARIGDAWRCYEASLVDRSTEGAIESERLKGEIHSAEARFGEQAHSLNRLLARNGDGTDAHVAIWYDAVAQLSRLACELPAPVAVSTVASALVARAVWPSDFNAQRFASLRSLAWCKVLAGDTLGSFRYLREAAALADTLGSAPLRALVMLDRAHFAHNAGEEHWCANEVAAASELLREVDWLHTQVEERSALPLLAEVLAPTDPDGAAAAIARHAQLAPALDPIATGVRGLVYLANGRTRDGVRDLSAAYDSFDRAGSEWRAGKAALALAKVTGATRWRLLALENLEFYASSWLFAQAQSLGDLPAAAEGVSLTPMQERVFHMICEGLSTDAIATRLGRSPSTIRNHIKLIFKALSVRSRAALVAKAAREGRFSLP
jgi:DNA-binding CsgD family transcriptional regulator